MKAVTHTGTLTLLLLLCAALLSAATSCIAMAQTGVDDVRSSTQAFARMLPGYTHDQRTELVEASRDILERVDDSISELDARMRSDWHTMSESSKLEVQNAMTELKIQRLIVAEGTGALGHVSVEAWSMVKEDFSASFVQLQSSWEIAIKTLNSQ